MANTVSQVDFLSDDLATFLAKATSNGTIDDLITASKQRPVAGDPVSSKKRDDLIDDFVLESYPDIRIVHLRSGSASDVLLGDGTWGPVAGAMPMTGSGTGSWVSDGATYHTLVDMGTVPTNTAWFYTGELGLASVTGGVIYNSVIQFRGTARRVAAAPNATTLSVLANGTTPGAAAQTIISTNNVRLQARSTQAITQNYYYRYTLTEIAP